MAAGWLLLSFSSRSIAVCPWTRRSRTPARVVEPHQVRAERELGAPASVPAHSQGHVLTEGRGIDGLGSTSVLEAFLLQFAAGGWVDPLGLVGADGQIQLQCAQRNGFRLLGPLDHR